MNLLNKILGTKDVTRESKEKDSLEMISKEKDSLEMTNQRYQKFLDKTKELSEILGSDSKFEIGYCKDLDVHFVEFPYKDLGWIRSRTFTKYESEWLDNKDGNCYYHGRENGKFVLDKYFISLRSNEELRKKDLVEKKIKEEDLFTRNSLNGLVLLEIIFEKEMINSGYYSELLKICRKEPEEYNSQYYKSERFIPKVIKKSNQYKLFKKGDIEFVRGYNFHELPEDYLDQSFKSDMKTLCSIMETYSNSMKDKSITGKIKSVKKGKNDMNQLKTSLIKHQECYADKTLDFVKNIHYIVRRFYSEFDREYKDVKKNINDFYDLNEATDYFIQNEDKLLQSINKIKQYDKLRKTYAKKINDLSLQIDTGKKELRKMVLNKISTREKLEEIAS